MISFSYSLNIWTTQVSLNHMQSWYSSCILSLPYFVFINLSFVFSTKQQSRGQNPMSCAFLNLTQHFTPQTLQNGCIEKKDTLFSKLFTFATYILLCWAGAISMYSEACQFRHWLSIVVLIAWWCHSYISQSWLFARQVFEREGRFMTFAWSSTLSCLKLADRKKNNSSFLFLIIDLLEGGTSKCHNF